MKTPRLLCALTGLLLLGGLLSCGQEDGQTSGTSRTSSGAGGQTTGQGPTRKLGYWEPLTEGVIHAKPVLEQPPARVPPEVYRRNRREALEMVVKKLSGGWGQRSWNFSKELLRRDQSDEVVEELIGFLNRYLASESLSNVAKTALQVMGSASSPVYAQALLSAAAHSDRTVREEALKALIQSGDEATTDQLMQRFSRSSTREKALFIRILSQQWPATKAVPLLRSVLVDSGPEGPILREQILRSFKEVEAAAETIRGSLEDNLYRFKGLDRITAASFLHKSGGEQGRLDLLQMLSEETNPKILVLLISGLSQRVPEASLEFVDRRLQQLNSSSGDAGGDPIVQAVLASYLGLMGGAAEVARLEVMARFEDSRIAHAALEALQGKKARLDWIAKAIQSATGSDLTMALESAIAARDEGSVSAILARLEKAEGADRWRFIQALGRSRASAAVPALIGLIRGEPMSDLLKGEIDSCSYAAEVIANVPDCEEALWGLYKDLGKDLIRRSLVIEALGKNALLSQDEVGRARKARIHARFRELFYDPQTPPRERLQFLGNMVMHSLEMADAMRLKRMLRKEETSERVFEDTINNLLFELF